MIAEVWLSFFRRRRKEARRTQTVLKTKGGAEREVQRPWIRKRSGERRWAEEQSTSGGVQGGDENAHEGLAKPSQRKTDLYLISLEPG
jgi:hypothetical protein